MTVKEIIEIIPTLSPEERRELMHALVDALAEAPTTEQMERIPGLHAGTTWVSDDFDDPLPDEFWLGEE
jgi:hypothetical protein